MRVIQITHLSSGELPHELSLKLCAISILAFAFAPARSQSPAVLLTDPIAFNNGQGYSLGYTFNSSTAFTITALGYYDTGNLSERHDVGIYNADGTLLTSATIDGTGPTFGPATGQFSYSASFAPITLGAGTYQIMGDTGFIDAYAFSPDTFSTSPNITFLADEFSYGSTLAFGKITDGQLGYFGPNFLETTSAADLQPNTPVTPTPEPGSLVLFGTGLIGVAAAIRRRLAN